jgi:ribose transport system substrate-binding protein
VSGIKNETDLTEQVNLVEQAVAQGAAAIVIAPADSKALVPALRRAQRRAWSLSISTTGSTPTS